MPDDWQRFLTFEDDELGQDPLAATLAEACEVTPEALHGPSPVLPGTIGKQLDALACDDKISTPGVTPQRIRWLEATSFRDVPTGDLVPEGSTWELARVDIPVASLGQIERVGTHVRAQPLDGAGGPVGAPFEFTPFVSLLQFPNTLNTVASPCPFPFPHPTVGVDPLTVRWDLRVQDLSDYSSGTFAPRITNGRRSQLPPEQLLPSWDDQRNAFGGRYSECKKLLVQGHVRVRLFGTVFAPSTFWDVRVGGTVQGFWQLGGPDGEAKVTATTRS